MPLRAQFLSRRALLLGFVIIAAIALLLGVTRLVAGMDLALQDSQNRILARFFPKMPARQVVVVGIDEESYRQLREPLSLWHPHLGEFLKAMATAKPAVVGLDIILPDRSFDWLVPNYDRRLLEGLLAARKETSLVLGLTLDETGVARKIHPPFVAIAGHDAFGYVMLPLDRDNIVRRYVDHRDEQGKAVPTLVGQMAQRAGIEPSSGGIDYGLTPPTGYIPFHQVLAWMSQGDAQRLRAEFAGKPVLLGSVLRYEDRHFQPINLAPWEPDNGLNVPGVMIQAQMLSSLLNQSMVASVPAAIVAGMCLLMSLLWFVRMRLAELLMLGSALIVLIYVASTVLLHQGVHVAAVALMLSAVVALLGRWMVESILEMQERRRLRRAFSGYVSPQMMEEILAGRLVGEPGGKECTVCVMFADVRGFTTLSESMSPQAVMAMLNRYFEKITQAIHAENGTINCIMGDGVMAIFGAPNSMANPSERAFAAARRMLAALPELNRELAAEGGAPLTIGIGLNVGKAIVGHVGSSTRHDYSAIGDTTNVAARLEGLTKEVGYPLVCSAAVAAALDFPAGLFDLGIHALKGRSPLQVYGWRPADGQEGSDNQRAMSAA